MTTNEKKNEIQTDVLNKIAGKKLAGASVSMGIGKTLIGLKDMDRILEGGKRIKPGYEQEKFFLVAAPTQAILDSWPQEAKKWNLDYLLPHIDFTTYLSLPRQLHKQVYHKVYLDECHSLKDTHAPQLENHVARCGAILGLTGTEPANPRSEKGRLVARFCPIVVDYTTDEAVLAGILNDYRIVVHHLPLSKERTLQITFKNGGKKMTSEYNEYWNWSARLKAAEEGSPDEKLRPDILRIMRMQAVMKFKSKEEYIQKLEKQFEEKVLLYTCNKEQAERVCTHTYVSGNKESKANLEQFNLGQIDRLAAVNQLSMGINIRNLKTIIIWHAFGNEHRASQKIGRALRLNPDETSTVHVLCYKDTVDETWVQKALANFDPEKIIHIEEQL